MRFPVLHPTVTTSILLLSSDCLALGSYFGVGSGEISAYDLPPPEGNEQDRFGEVDIPLGDTTQNLWTQNSLDASMYSQYNQPLHPPPPSPSNSQHPPLLQQYALPPTDEAGGYSTLAYLTQDAPQPFHQQILAHEHEQQYGQSFSISPSGYPLSYDGMATANTAAMAHMSVAGESEPFPRVRTGRDSSASASSSRTRGARARARAQSWARQLEGNGEDEGGENPYEERGVRQPQSARVHQNRSQFVEEVILPSAPSTARITTMMSPARQAAAMRNWVQEEWTRRGVSVYLPAQRLAQEVAKMKIVHPSISKSIGRASLTIAERVRGQEPWFMYDLYSWTETYKQRINNLRGKYLLEGRYSEEQIQQRQLENVLIVAPTHYATLADPAEEAAEVTTARDVWAEFSVVQLGTIPTEEGPSLPVELLARHSYDWHASDHNEAMSRKFINKYLRCVLHWSLAQLEQLERLQLALEEQGAPKRVRAPAPRARRVRRTQ